MSRLLFLLICIILGWFIVKIILKGIITTFRGNWTQNHPGRNPGFDRNGTHPETQQKFDDIKDAEYTDITDTTK